MSAASWSWGKKQQQKNSNEWLTISCLVPMQIQVNRYADYWGVHVKMHVSMSNLVTVCWQLQLLTIKTKFITFFVILPRDRQNDGRTNTGCHITSLADDISSGMHWYSPQYTHIHMLVTLQSSTLFMASSISSLSRSALAVSAWVFVPEIIDLVACNHLNWRDRRNIRMNVNLLLLLGTKTV